jgi:dTDP-4-dehydrorhamnose reductase
MSLKILLTGKNGQIGHELTGLLPQLGEVVALNSDELDLLKPEEIRRAIRSVRPNLIVNAAAYTAVDQAETDQAGALAVNAEAPAVMAEEAKKIGAALVHYSSDYVYDGSKNVPYVEDDPPNPLSHYGKTKLAGDLAIQNSGVAHLIIRTAWVYGTRGKNFLRTILQLATQCEELRIVRDQTGAPTWSREIARATTEVLAQLTEHGDISAALSGDGGIYHTTASGETNWYELTLAILEEAARVPPTTPWLRGATGGMPLITRRVVPITTREYPTPARRPAYSVLSNSRLKQKFGIEIPSWRTQLRSAFQGL